MQTSVEEVRKCQIKRCYQEGPSDETLKKSWSQFCDVMFIHRIMEGVGLFDYKMRSFTQITFNFTNRRIKGVASWFFLYYFTEVIFSKITCNQISDNNRQTVGFFNSIRIWPNRDLEHKDLFRSSWQVVQYNSNVFNMAYDLTRAVL